MKFTRKKGRIVKGDLPGYPIYPDSEDIFNQFNEEKGINPEDISSTKDINGITELKNEAEHEDMPGSDLDIPGTELDDGQEIIGSEDEENNYYSLGGENHENLEENQED